MPQLPIDFAFGAGFLTLGALGVDTQVGSEPIWPGPFGADIF